MLKKNLTAWIVAALFLFPVALIAYRVLALGYPLFPAAGGSSWRISMETRISRPSLGQAVLTVGLPYQRPGLTVLEEFFSSGTLGLGLTREGLNRFAIWSGEVGSEGELVTYNASVIVRRLKLRSTPPLRLMPYPPQIGEKERALLERLPLPPPTRLDNARAAIRGEWPSPAPAQEDLTAWRRFILNQGRELAIIGLLRAARLNAREVQGLRLTPSIRLRPLKFIEVWSGSEWLHLRPVSGEALAIPQEQFLRLSTGIGKGFRVSEARVDISRWEVRRRLLGDWHLHYERIRRSTRFLDKWSFFHMPRQFQETFQILLLVPIGALMISLLRNMVGFPTFGVFMPVLMALAFRTTGLAYGLGVFAFIMGAGYFMRNFLDRMHLLLVPRLSLMLTAVIALLSFVALAGNQFGIREFMAVGLLPFVILVMVIERFFVAIEEAGVRQGIQMALGSAAVAIIAYSILLWEQLQLTFFLYPELTFAVGGALLLIGRYTGYRLFELVRFKAFRSQP